MSFEVSRVQSIKNKFESLSSQDDTLFTISSKPKPVLFQRSRTSLNLMPSKSQNENSDTINKHDKKDVPILRVNKNKFLRQTDDIKRASIKRSNAFRKCPQVYPTHQNLNLTDTLKKALRQPLPKGPPPKKPPRTFEVNIRDLASVQIPERNQIIKKKSSKNVLAQLNCACVSNIYDKIAEPIYMEPFMHNQESSMSDNKRASISKSIPVQQCCQSNSLNLDTHYLCTDIADTSKANDLVELISPSMAYDQINILVDAAFNEDYSSCQNGSLIEKGHVNKIVRSLTEKRVDYVRRTTSRKDNYTNDVQLLYGTTRVSRKTQNLNLLDMTNNREKNSSANINKQQKCKKILGENQYTSISSPNKGSLFVSCILFGYDLNLEKPYTKWSFPDSVELPHNIGEMVFPNHSCIYKQDVLTQNFTQIFTDISGNRLYGYCRRVRPEASDIFLPLCYVILSKHLAPGLYFYLVKEIESLHGFNENHVFTILEKLSTEDLPQPGGKIYCTIPPLATPKEITLQQYKYPRRLSLQTQPKWLKSNVINQHSASDHFLKEVIYIKRPADLRLESEEITILHDIVGTELLLSIFGTLLLERKVILICDNVSILSKCVIGIINILYPFIWQYPLVTCLPDNLIEICQAPVPLLIGCSQNIDFPIQDAVVVNLDRKLLIQRCGDENTILPQELRKSLQTSLELVDVLDESKRLSNVLIAEAFLRFFVELLNNLEISTFDKREFLECQKNISNKLFLEWFVETAMFHHFITMQYEEKAVNNQNYVLFFNKLKERSIYNTGKSIENLEALMKNCHIINPKKSKTFSERIRRLFST